MAMTRKQYLRVAEIIREEREAAALLTESMRSAVMVSTFIMAGKMATMFSADNPHFNQEVFYEACGFDR